MTWTRFQFGGNGFTNEAGVENVIVAAPKDVAVRWWEDTYGQDPERVTDDAIAWVTSEKDDPDVFARFILGEVEFGGVGVSRTRDAELADMRQSDAVRVVMPTEMAEWGHESDEDPGTPERPFVPEHIDLPDQARGPPSPFRNVRDEDPEDRGRGPPDARGGGRGRNS